MILGKKKYFGRKEYLENFFKILFFLDVGFGYEPNRITLPRLLTLAPAGRNEGCKSFLTFGFGDEPNRIT